MLKQSNTRVWGHPHLQTDLDTEVVVAVKGSEEAKRIALGRPRLDSQSYISVTWKVRASAQLDGMVDDLARREGRTRSALLRDAVAEYARTHQAV